jgi:NodT family efflux transporter outer membrane factor (OMF) lipoprotein
MMIRHAWMTLAAVLGVAACEAGPHYVAPRATLAPFHNAAALRGRNAGTPPPLDTWWRGFGDPVLNGLIEQALKENLDLAASFARVQQARAAAGSAAANLRPTVDASAQGSAYSQSLTGPFGRIGALVPGYNRDQRIYDGGVAASWEIDIAGGLRRNREAADATAQAATADLAGMRVTVAAEVADAYLQIRADQARITTVSEQIEVDGHSLALVRQLRSRGIGDERQVTQAEAVLAQAQAALPPLHIEREGQLNRLDILLGAQPGTLAAPLSRPSPVPPPPAIPDSVMPTDFLRRRPDVIAAERQLAASNARIGVAVSDYYPKLSLSGLLGWRIFDFGKVDAEVAHARGANAEALARYRQTVLRAAGDVEDAFNSLTESASRTSRLEAEVHSLQRSRDLSQQAFAAGAIPLTDVLDADRQLLTARDALEENRGDAARAAVRSYRALGGGWGE